MNVYFGWSLPNAKSIANTSGGRTAIIFTRGNNVSGGPTPMVLRRGTQVSGGCHSAHRHRKPAQGQRQQNRRHLHRITKQIHRHTWCKASSAITHCHTSYHSTTWLRSTRRQPWSLVLAVPLSFRCVHCQMRCMQVTSRPPRTIL